MAICQKMEEDMVVITLKSLPRAYEHFIETLNITSTNVDLKFDKICNKLLQQDRWKKQFDSSNETNGSKQGFATKLNGKGKWAMKTRQNNGKDVTKD
jgi:hypothetical protein